MRGYIYEVSKEKKLGEIDENSFFDKNVDAECFSNEDQSQALFLTEWLSNHGAETGVEDGYPYFILTNAVKMDIFKERFEKVLEMMENMDLQTFSTSTLYFLRSTIEDTYDDAISENDGFEIFDRWIREAETDVKYFIGNVVMMRQSYICIVILAVLF